MASASQMENAPQRLVVEEPVGSVATAEVRPDEGVYNAPHDTDQDLSAATTVVQQRTNPSPKAAIRHQHAESVLDEIALTAHQLRKVGAQLRSREGRSALGQQLKNELRETREALTHHAGRLVVAASILRDPQHRQQIGLRREVLQRLESEGKPLTDENRQQMRETILEERRQAAELKRVEAEANSARRALEEQKAAEDRLRQEHLAHEQAMADLETARREEVAQILARRQAEDRAHAEKRQALLQATLDNLHAQRTVHVPAVQTKVRELAALKGEDPTEQIAAYDEYNAALADQIASLTGSDAKPADTNEQRPNAALVEPNAQAPVEHPEASEVPASVLPAQPLQKRVFMRTPLGVSSLSSDAQLTNRPSDAIGGSTPDIAAADTVPMGTVTPSDGAEASDNKANDQPEEQLTVIPTATTGEEVAPVDAENKEPEGATEASEHSAAMDPELSDRTELPEHGEVIVTPNGLPQDEQISVKSPNPTQEEVAGDETQSLELSDDTEQGQPKENAEDEKYQDGTEAPAPNAPEYISPTSGAIEPNELARMHALYGKAAPEAGQEGYTSSQSGWLNQEGRDRSASASAWLVAGGDSAPTTESARVEEPGASVDGPSEDRVEDGQDGDDLHNPTTAVTATVDRGDSPDFAQQSPNESPTTHSDVAEGVGQVNPESDETDEYDSREIEPDQPAVGVDPAELQPVSFEATGPRDIQATRAYIAHLMSQLEALRAKRASLSPSSPQRRELTNQASALSREIIRYAEPLQSSQWV